MNFGTLKNTKFKKKKKKKNIGNIFFNLFLLPLNFPSNILVAC